MEYTPLRGFTIVLFSLENKTFEYEGYRANW
jgi:hypothetical protein